ncbi:unnamed protein product [Didymodactylos carnosus]|uniref:Uncharacterized protein n=1 Tax=Didymodactylos carnosus TaxID=1234261 RepID=A0A815WR39_9BILA|nr:unnamed protein product [Didymodactylos carnosus]CAF1544034.1 unnamed protein product [Didymodactylos carnosus]CAF3962245.1 unnamed protein product [Didymodactylos carnosus]CAF4404591.1 unnamed protein product [Didymodactylos carnosus]
MSHMRADILSWIVRGKVKQERVQKEKTTIIETIQTKTGLPLNQCDSNSCTTGGTSTTGGERRKFFSYAV